MKAINFLFLLAITILAYSCDTANKDNNNLAAEADSAATVTTQPLELITVTQYDADSTLKEVFQVDKNTNKKNGWYKMYDENGILFLEREYKNDRRSGVEKTYYENGQVESESILRDSKYDGPFTYYFEDGKLKQEGQFVDDQMDGLLKTYYNNGNLKEEVMLEASMTKGPFKEYNENGTIKTEGTYNYKEDREELETGELKKYDDKGELAERMLCKDGDCCTVWTKKKGDVKPSNDYCARIIDSVKESLK